MKFLTTFLTYGQQIKNDEEYPVTREKDTMTFNKLFSTITLAGVILVASVQVSNATAYFDHKKFQSSPKKSVAYKEESTNVLKKHYLKWQGTRYQAGGVSRSGVDCSGFTKVTFKEIFGRNLPRTASEQSLSGKKVTSGNLKAGDLVFFKRGHNTQHVGIYLENGKFMHASSTHGVSISSMNNQYWKEKFYKATRY